MLQNFIPWLGLVAVCIAVLLIIYCAVLHAKINRLQKKYDFFMAGSDGASIERKLLVEVSELREASKAMEMLFQQQSMLKKVQTDTLQKIGFVKYNAFENIGNDLSFSLTLLDGNNNGICISSIYGRNESRIFSKPIVAGKSLVNLSQEELTSLNDALSNKSNKETLANSSLYER